MAKADSIQNGLKTDATDDVEKSLELLDKVLSEFEEDGPDRMNHNLHHHHHHHNQHHHHHNHHHAAVEPDSPSQGHQSEDDGYMSMNGRRAKFVPDFQPTDEANATLQHPQEQQQQGQDQQLQDPSLQQQQQPQQQHHLPLQQQHSLQIPTDESYSPPSPEEAERIISNLLPRISPTTSPKRRQTSENGQTEWRSSHQSSRTSDAISIGMESDNSSDNKPSSREETIITKSPTQTTLPKTRPPNAMPQRYASLPCSSPPKLQGSAGPNDAGGGSLDGGRNKLGIGISAVHDAVLRGMARLPEPILNEHPVTIYPGRASPTRRMPPRTLSGSIERHRDVCRGTGANPYAGSDNSTSTSQENSSPENNESEYNESSLSPTHGHLNPLGATLASRIFHPSAQSSPIVAPVVLASNQPFLLQPHRGQRGAASSTTKAKTGPAGARTSRHDSDDDERFSDDSLEDSSLPPPPGPPTVPPPPSLSAPVTPSKRHSIAWEVNLDDPASFGDPLAPIPPKPSASAPSAKVIGRRKNAAKNATSSQSSLESTPSNVKSESNEWPAPPPDIPICSTEDEAASIYSDSDDLIPHIPDVSGRGTYVIRKGRRQRQRLTSLESDASNNGILPPTVTATGDDHILGLPSPIFPVSMMTPKSRHSIDLGLSATAKSGVSSLIKPSQSAPQKLPNSVLSPRSRLSLDLSSPTTSELSTNVIKITTPTGSYPSPVSVHHQAVGHVSSPLGAPSTGTGGSGLPLHQHGGGALNGIMVNGMPVNGPSKPPATNVSSTHIVNLPAAGVASGSNQPQSSSSSGSSAATQSAGNRYSEFKTYSSTFDPLDSPSSGVNGTTSTGAANGGCGGGSNGSVSGIAGGCSNGSDNPLLRVSSLPSMPPPLTSSATADGLSTPRRELAPPIEEDEEADSDTQRGVPLRKIEDNISALLRGDISVARVADIPPARRPLGFRLGVHKSESAKEMLLSQAGLGPLPPSPPSSSPEPDSDEFPPLPPSPTEEPGILHPMHGIRISSRNRTNGSNNGLGKHDSMHSYRDDHPPAIPPHRGPSINTLKTRSMDAGFSKSYRNGSFGSSTSPHAPGTLPPDLPGCNSRRRVITGGYQKRTAQSPREERSLQTSCSLPETPIFARGCDIPRTPHRRAPEVPPHGSGSRTAPRTNSTTGSLGSGSVVGISASTTIGSRQRSISQALANGEMLRLAGGPARGWYPKQRHPRPASTENLDRLHPQGSLRAWEAAGTGSRKPLTLPPNLTPKFFNKSPREALRRVTSLLIRKGNSGTKEKESKKDRDQHHQHHHQQQQQHQQHHQHQQHQQQQHQYQQPQHRDSSTVFLQRSPGSDVPDSRGNFPQQSSQHTTPTTQKKKGFFKSFWKKSRHYSLEKQ
ncbi:mucin-5AC-like isoform X2 [Anopheles albimanus]|uniref:mucin-5AC-like isoform X2 n=1 Tax=Anopheles albimanus TaxID=7167 RepID=UPI001641C9A4|nr:mucin-5AC-like isoform X2 [Anopheles albimanus]